MVRYDGVPVTQQLILGPDFTIEAGFIHTDDGAMIAGQPDVAATWFPVNDHPIDKASYTFVVTAPPASRSSPTAGCWPKHHGARTWLWHAPEPMASYLATATIGQFDSEVPHRRRAPDVRRDRPGPVRRAVRRPGIGHLRRDRGELAARQARS